VSLGAGLRMPAAVGARHWPEPGEKQIHSPAGARVDVEAGRWLPPPGRPPLGLFFVVGLVLDLGRRVAMAVGAGARRVTKECRMGPRYLPTWFSGQERYLSKGQQGPYVDGLARPRS
jgi:hypothetical protein